MFWLQEFDLDICDKSETQNLVVDHLNKIERVADDAFDLENIINYIISSIFPPLASKAQIDKIQTNARYYVLAYPYLWKLCSDQVIRRCILDHEIDSILQHCHSSVVSGHLDT